MIIKIAICEDEPDICNFFASKIRDTFLLAKQTIILDIFFDSEVLLQAALRKQYHVYFLDIDMPQRNGINTAQELKKMQRHPLILFLSNREYLVYQSFSAAPLRFIRKSHFDEEISEAVQAILSETTKQKVLTVEINRALVTIPVENILYIESMKRIQIIHTTTSTHELYDKMENFEQELSGCGFLRVHKSFLVNYQYIFSIESNCILLTDNTKIPLSKHRAAETKAAYRRLLERI